MFQGEWPVEGFGMSKWEGGDREEGGFEGEREGAREMSRKRRGDQEWGRVGQRNGQCVDDVLCWTVCDGATALATTTRWCGMGAAAPLPFSPSRRHREIGHPQGTTTTAATTTHLVYHRRCSTE